MLLTANREFKLESVETLQARLNISSESIPELNGLKAQLRYKKDSLVWLNVNLASGVLILKAALFPDSFIIYNRLEKDIIKGNYSTVEDLYGWKFNFPMLQSILLNSILNERNLQISSETQQEFEMLKQIIIKMDNVFPITATHQIDNRNNYLIKSHYVTPDAIWIVDYDEFNQVNTIPFPELYRIEIRRAKDIFILEIKIDKIEMNQTLSFPFNLPNN